MSKLDALEVSLRALHGEDVNGNVDKALERIGKAREAINSRLSSKVGDYNIGNGVD